MKTRAELISKSIELEKPSSRWECTATCEEGEWIVGVLAQNSSDRLMVDSEIMSCVGRAIEEFDAEMFVCTHTIHHSLDYSENRVCIIVR